MTGDSEGATGESSSRDGLCSGSDGASVGSAEDEDEVEAEVIIPGVVLRSWSAAIPDVCCTHTHANKAPHQTCSLD